MSQPTQITTETRGNTRSVPARRCYRFLYLIKPRLRSAPPGALPGSGRASAPAFGPLGTADADARPHVDRPVGMSRSPQRAAHGQDDASGGGSAGTGMEGAPFPTAGP